MKKKESRSLEKDTEVRPRGVNDDLKDLLPPEPPLAPPKAKSDNIQQKNKNEKR